METELYKNKLSRYIHLNPVKLKSLENESAVDLKKLLRDYQWSGFRYYLGIAGKPAWLNRSFVLSTWGQATDGMRGSNFSFGSFVGMRGSNFSFGSFVVCMY